MYPDRLYEFASLTAPGKTPALWAGPLGCTPSTNVGSNSGPRQTVSDLWVGSSQLQVLNARNHAYFWRQLSLIIVRFSTQQTRRRQRPDIVGRHIGHVSSIDLHNLIAGADAGLVGGATTLDGNDVTRYRSRRHSKAVHVRPLFRTLIV